VRSAFLERVRRRLSTLFPDGFANQAVILYALRVEDLAARSAEFRQYISASALQP
jgi:hypothetical protein